MIELKDVTKVYRMGEIDVVALNGVTIHIKEGELMSIMGPSGSGKSTLMNVLGCLDAPTSGTYHFEDQDVGSLNDNGLANIRNRKIGFVFQTYNLLPRLTALGNVELPMLYGKKKNRRQRALEALDRVGLGDRVRHRPRNSLEANSSAWESPGRWPRSRRSCWPTSPAAISIAPPARRS